MGRENLEIKIEGEDLGEELRDDLLGLTVELDCQLASMLRLRLKSRHQSDGMWSNVDDERLRVGKKVEIAAGFESGPEELITAYITHVKPVFEPDPSNCSLEIWGLDESVLMDREEKLHAWPNKKDSDIAREVFQSYGFDVSGVEDTEIVHDEAISTIIQRETDIQFLNRLALRNGYVCYVDNGKAFFRPPQVDAEPQPVLAFHYGDESTVEWLRIDVNGLAPSHVAMSQLDPTSKEVLETAAESSQQTVLGEIGADGLLTAGIPPGRVYLGTNITTGTPEMATLCQGLFHRAEWFITAEGEIESHHYGHVLKPRLPVPIKGVSASHSGVYFVCSVTHSFQDGGYKQLFKARRNAILPTGTEVFSAASDGLF